MWTFWCRICFMHEIFRLFHHVSPIFARITIFQYNRFIRLFYNFSPFVIFFVIFHHFFAFSSYFTICRFFHRSSTFHLILSFFDFFNIFSHIQNLSISLWRSFIPTLLTSACDSHFFWIVHLYQFGIRFLNTCTLANK